MKNRIGVYICHCGSNISDYVDVEKVREAVEQEAGVVLARTTMFACADSAQKEIIEDIQQQKLDAMVVASCSPKLHLFTFRNVAIRAGLNPYNYVQVNIREQGSWAHSDNPEKATEKAINLVLAGIARVKHSEALVLRDIPSENSIVIVGAGVAGMRAAIELSDIGTTVYLLERSHFTGGRTAQWKELYTTDESGPELVIKLYDTISQIIYPRRHLFFYSSDGKQAAHFNVACCTEIAERILVDHSGKLFLYFGGLLFVTGAHTLYMDLT